MKIELTNSEFVTIVTALHVAKVISRAKHPDEEQKFKELLNKLGTLYYEESDT